MWCFVTNLQLFVQNFLNEIYDSISNDANKYILILFCRSQHKSLQNLKLGLALQTSVLSAVGSISLVCKQWCCKLSWLQHYPSLKVIMLSIFVTKAKHSHFGRNPGEMWKEMVLFVICLSMSLKPNGMEMKSTVYIILHITSVSLHPRSKSYWFHLLK